MTSHQYVFTTNLFDESNVPQRLKQSSSTTQYTITFDIVLHGGGGGDGGGGGGGGGGDGGGCGGVYIFRKLLGFEICNKFVMLTAIFGH